MPTCRATKARSASVEIIAPEGTLVNARPPAPLTMCTVFPAHEIMHMIWWALGQADPTRGSRRLGQERFPGDVRAAMPTARTWVMYHWGGNSGAGAVAGATASTRWDR